MKIAIIDADLIHNGNSRFPNLSSMKLAQFYREQGHSIELVTNYKLLTFFGKACYDKIFISKVFTKSIVPLEILELDCVECGGTGFSYPNEAKALPTEIEHIMPYYDLYKNWADNEIEKVENKIGRRQELKYFYDYSIGFLSRKCFRQCWFCVNKHYKKAEVASNVLEFYDRSRPRLCFLDDNFFALFNDWENIINEVKSLNIPFQFKQGLDERLLTEKHIHELVSWKYDGDFIFAFDNIEDKDIIEKKLQLLYSLYPKFNKRLKFYVFCGACDENEILKDVENVFIRCFILAKYSALPYIMRYETIYNSKYSSFYSTLASWANQPSFFKKMTFREFARARGLSNNKYKIYKNNIEKYIKEGNKMGSCFHSMIDFEKEFPQISRYFDIAGDMLLEYGNGKSINIS